LEFGIKIYILLLKNELWTQIFAIANIFEWISAKMRVKCDLEVRYVLSGV